MFVVEMKKKRAKRRTKLQHTQKKKKIEKF